MRSKLGHVIFGHYPISISMIEEDFKAFSAEQHSYLPDDKREPLPLGPLIAPLPDECSAEENAFF